MLFFFKMNIEPLYQLFLRSTGVCTDTRILEKGNLFFALKGPSFDGNEFADVALSKGALAVVGSDTKIKAHADKAFLVKDTLIALQQLATYHREKCNTPLIALTGSNGKTTTKELIRAVLQTKYKVLATQGNFNNHIGVPLTLLQLTSDHDIGIIEGFGSVEGVIQGKSELYSYLIKNQQHVLINGDDPIQVKATQNAIKHSFGTKNDADYIWSAPQTNSSKGWALTFEKNPFESNLYGDYNLPNLVAAISFGHLFDVPLKAIQKGISSYQADNNRSQELTIGPCHIILDAYNANPSSMSAALSAFSSVATAKSALILGDMKELGAGSLKEHNALLKAAVQSPVGTIYALGEHFMTTTEQHAKIQRYPNIDAFLAYVPLPIDKHDRLLIKGSRSMRLERIIPYLKNEKNP
jgi:UDP-N-acetylmuramoyl-tripeptide--D-alanyl-D-alanine ligase